MQSSKSFAAALKKTASVFIAAAVLLTGYAAASALTPSGGVCGEETSWTLDETGKLVITGIGGTYDYDAERPAPWNGAEIAEIVISSGVTGIGDYAFACCGVAQNVSLPEGITSIGSAAFYGCAGLTSLIIPRSVESIGSNAFFGCGATLYVFDGSAAHLYAQMNRLPHAVIKKGDLDGDGEITVSDALAALRVAAELIEETPLSIVTGDADGDGRVTVADALAILRVAAKLADSL